MEDFVTYEQAKILKDLGFDWECLYPYTEKKIIGYHPSPINWNNDENAKYGIISAPTLAQAQKWLREAKGILILIQHNKNFYWTISTNESDDEVIAIYEYETYEKALLGAINKALEIIKNK